MADIVIACLPAEGLQGDDGTFHPPEHYVLIDGTVEMDGTCGHRVFVSPSSMAQIREGAALTCLNCFKLDTDPGSFVGLTAEQVVEIAQHRREHPQSE